MVPVGGAIVASPSKEVIMSISKMYPGRASSAPILDLFITMLSMGASGFKQLLDDRRAMYEYLKRVLSKVGEKYGSRILETGKNDISIGIIIAKFGIISKRSDWRLTLLAV